MANADEAPEGALALSVITPVRRVAETSVSMVTMPGVDGDFGAMPGHMAFITTLRPGVVTYDEGGMPRRVAVSGGIVEVTGGKVVILARTAEPAQEVDLDRARRARESAESQLSSLTYADGQWARWEAKLARAIARITTAEG